MSKVAMLAPWQKSHSFLELYQTLFRYKPPQIFPLNDFSTYPLSHFVFFFSIFVEIFPDKLAWTSNVIAVGVLARSWMVTLTEMECRYD